MKQGQSGAVQVHEGEKPSHLCQCEVAARTFSPGMLNMHCGHTAPFLQPASDFLARRAVPNFM